MPAQRQRLTLTIEVDWDEAFPPDPATLALDLSRHLENCYNITRLRTRVFEEAPFMVGCDSPNAPKRFHATTTWPGDLCHHKDYAHGVGPNDLPCRKDTP